MFKTIPEEKTQNMYAMCNQVKCSKLFIKPEDQWSSAKIIDIKGQVSNILLKYSYIGHNIYNQVKCSKLYLDTKYVITQVKCSKQYLSTK